ncbi:toll-like receptor 6 [Schistocerca piceifrons]|uniref:toll-like receptor 6 n=1 Tax=Schistocerca piceifrons TaxID=274613 RepID=UPI001F5E7F47|nr:toll-like receptor 6 [Schistocerca piceifrons]
MSVCSRICLAIVAVSLLFDVEARSIASEHEDVRKGCGWERTSPYDVGHGKDEDAVRLDCQLRTIDGMQSVIENLTLPQIDKVQSLRIECSDVLFYESKVSGDGLPDHTGRGFLSQLRRLRELSIETCKILQLPRAAFSSLRDLRNLTVRTYIREWLAATALEFDQETFLGLSELRSLDLSHNNIWKLPDELFCPLFSLSRLNMSHNRLQDMLELDFSASAGKTCSLVLEFLDLSHNDIPCVPDNGLTNLRSLRELYLQNNAITSLGDSAFSGVNKLQVLNASSNELEALPPEVFQPTRGLREIYLRNNSISVLAPGLLEGLDQLTVLDLSHNYLTSSWINKNTFSGLVRLVVLNLGYNNIARVDPHVFTDVYSLQVLNLEHNGIDTITEGAFSALSNLHVLTLSHNKLAHVDYYYFSGLFVVNQLYLDNNKLTAIHQRAFENCTHLQDLGLSNNLLTVVPAALGKLHFLRFLDIGSNSIVNVSNNSFDGLGELYALRLMNNNLENLPRDTFSSLPRVHFLNVANNNIRFVEAGSFANNPLLRMLRLDGNQLTDISGIVSHLPGLIWLNVSNNRIEWFDYSFVPHSLQWLDLHKNKLKELRNYYETGSTLRLLMIDASFNYITEIGESSLPDSVEVVFLNNNRITTVAPNTFIKKTNLSRVVLYANNIEKMDMSALTVNPLPEERELPQFYIGGNPFVCDCDMEWLQRINHLGYLRRHPVILDLDTIVCTLVFSRGVKTKPLMEVDPLHFVCTYEMHCFALCHCCDFDACDCEMACPDNCTCYHDTAWASNIVDCANAGYKHVPHRIPMDATEIYLDGNDIGELPSHVFIGKKKLEVLFLNNSNIENINNKTFNGVTSLRVLHLENNRIRELHGYEFEKMSTLNELYLENNEIASVGNATFADMPHLEVLRLEGNRLEDFRPWEQLAESTQTRLTVGGVGNVWRCDCESAARLRAWAHRDTLERLACAAGGSVADALLRCDRPRRGNDAAPSSVVQRGPADADGAAGSAFATYAPFLAAAVAALLLAAAAALGYRFRHEVRFWAHSRYGVRLFGTAPAADRDDDRERLYDAYIVYSVGDEDFAERLLAAELEQRGYAVCLHYRDIQVDPESVYLADSVASAAEASRRLLVVMSRCFIDCEWTRPDFRRALGAVLSAEQNPGRLVVLVKCEPSPDLRPLLRGCVPIAWGDRRCWDRLWYAMPDVRRRGGRPLPAATAGAPAAAAGPVATGRQRQGKTAATAAAAAAAAAGVRPVARYTAAPTAPEPRVHGQQQQPPPQAAPRRQPAPSAPQQQQQQQQPQRHPHLHALRHTPTTTPTQSTYVSENSSQRTTDHEEEDEEEYGPGLHRHSYMQIAEAGGEQTVHVYSSIPDTLPLRAVGANGRTYFV